jgi:hypothetical protein
MIAEEGERGLVVVASCEDNSVDEANETLNSVERTADQHQHQNHNTSNLDMGVHHRDLSHHPHHPLDNSSDPTNALFPHQQHLQPHRHDLNGSASSTDVNHISGSDLLQQHLLTHNTLNPLNVDQHPLHHTEQQHHHQYQHQQQQQLQEQGHHHHNLNHQSQQQQQHPFSYHHEQHTSGEDENDAIVEATTALQHDVSVVDVAGLHQHPHSTEINPISEHHHHNHHMNPPRLMHQEHEHQMTLAMAYPTHQYTQQYQQGSPQLQQQQQHQDREREGPSASVDTTQTSLGMASSMFPPQNSPLTVPPRQYPQKLKKESDPSSPNNHKNTSRRSKKSGINTSKITGKKRRHKQQGISISDGTLTERGSAGIVGVKKLRRRRYDNNFKAEVLNHLKGPHTKLLDVARRYGIPENTLREWTKVDVVRAIETARSKNSGQLKANMYDPMKRLTETLMVFFEHNRRQPDHLRQSITTKLIVAKVSLNIVGFTCIGHTHPGHVNPSKSTAELAFFSFLLSVPLSASLPLEFWKKGLEARNTLLQRHATHPFLEPKEKKALESFSGSDSWAKKFAKRRDLKMTGARIKELSEEDVNQFHHSLKQMSNRIKQAGPGYEDAAMLIRQAAEKLLLASIIHSTASHRLMGNIVSNSRNDRKLDQASRSKPNRHQQSNTQTSKPQLDELVQAHILQNSLNIATPTTDHPPLSP